MPGVNPDIDHDADGRETREELFRTLNRMQDNLENSDVDIVDYDIREQTVNDADGEYALKEVTITVEGHPNDVR